MRYLKLEDYIATLSEGEKEQYKCLIQEFRERDIILRKNHDESRRNLENLARDLETCGKAATSLKNALVDLNATINEVHSKILSCSKAVAQPAQHYGNLFQEYPKSLN